MSLKPGKTVQDVVFWESRIFMCNYRLSQGGFSVPSEQAATILFARINRRTAAAFPINQQISPSPEKTAGDHQRTSLNNIQRLQSIAELVGSKQVNSPNCQQPPSDVLAHQGVTISGISPPRTG